MHFSNQKYASMCTTAVNCAGMTTEWFQVYVFQGVTGACNSVVDYTTCDSLCVAKPVKKETETTFFTTETTQQK